MSHKENHIILSAECDNISHYRRTCNFTPSKFDTEIKKTKFKLPGDQKALGLFDVVINDNRTQLIRAEFEDNSLYEDKRKVSFQGPSLFSKCKISGVQKDNCHREFGYIQTSKKLFEKEFDKTIVYSDFHANLLHGLDEVLDSDLENYPFYSIDSYCKVPADKSPPNEIDLCLSDCPSSETLKRFDCSSIETSSISDWYNQDEFQDSDIKSGSLHSNESENKFQFDKTLQKENNVGLPVCPSSDTLKSFDCSTNEKSLKPDFGCLRKQKTYQQFFVYLVMRSKKEIDVEWKYDVLFSFDWFIYLKWTKVTDKNNNIFEYNCGLNEHETLRGFPKLMEYYHCNDDQFEYWIDGENITLYLDKTPNSISDNKLETIYETIYCFISKTKEFCEKLENKDSEEENNQRMGNEFFENINSKVRKLLESMKTVNSKKHKIDKRVVSLHREVKKSEGAETNNIGSKVRRLHEIIKEMDHEIDDFSENYTKTAKAIKELYNNFKGNDSVEDKIYEDIENLLPDIKELINNFEQRDLIKNTFYENSENFENFDDKVKILYANIESMNIIENDVYENFGNFLPNIEKLDKNIERVYLEKYEFSENFRYMTVEMKRLCELMKFLDWEKNKFRKNYKSIVSDLKYTNNMDSASLKIFIESLINEFEKIFKDDKIDLETFKFCKCNNLSKTEFCAKIKEAIIERNLKEKKERNHKNDEQSVTAQELQVDKKFSPLINVPGIIQDKNQRINEACSSEIL